MPSFRYSLMCFDQLSDLGERTGRRTARLAWPVFQMPGSSLCDYKRNRFRSFIKSFYQIKMFQLGLCPLEPWRTCCHLQVLPQPHFDFRPWALSSNAARWTRKDRKDRKGPPGVWSKPNAGWRPPSSSSKQPKPPETKKQAKKRRERKAKQLAKKIQKQEDKEKRENEKFQSLRSEILRLQRLQEFRNKKIDQQRDILVAWICLRWFCFYFTTKLINHYFGMIFFFV